MPILASNYDSTLYETTYSTDPTSYTYSSAYASSYNPFASFIWFAIAVLIVVSMWKIFTKAGKPGWAAIVPFYNIWVMLEVAGKPGWWIIFFFIPLVNLIFLIIVSLSVAKAFGKSSAFGFFGLFLFGFIGYPMLAFGNAKYKKPSTK